MQRFIEQTQDGFLYSKVFAKAVLAGEHSILRGGSAIVLPVPQFQMIFRWKWSEDLQKTFPFSFEKMEHLFQKGWSFIEAQSKYSLQIEKFASKFKKEKVEAHFFYPDSLSIESTIPEGSGLGSSAALCVLFSRMLLSRLEIDDFHFSIELATFLENEFHGKSSGMDVKSVSYGEPILIQSPSEMRVLKSSEDLKFYFFDTGIRSKTKDCIEKVNHYFNETSFLKMQKAVQLAHEGLIENQPEKIKKSFQLSMEVYETWQLLNDEILVKIHQLKVQYPHLDFRLTGSGSGGFLIGF